MPYVTEDGKALNARFKDVPAVFNDMVESVPFGEFDPLEPQVLRGIFARNLVSSPVRIEAPADLVWSIVVDFDCYPEWNPLNRFFYLDSGARVGATVTFGPRWGPYDAGTLGDAHFTQRETLTVWEENHCLAYAVISPWFNAERVQYVTPLADERTHYQTYERTSGVISPLVRLLYHRRIIDGFDANAVALKHRAERLHARRKDS